MVKLSGFVRLHSDKHPYVYRFNGQLYVNDRDGKLYVTLGGEWTECRDDADAKRKVIEHLGLKRKTRWR